MPYHYQNPCKTQLEKRKHGKFKSAIFQILFRAPPIFSRANAFGKATVECAEFYDLSIFSLTIYMWDFWWKKGIKVNEWINILWTPNVIIYLLWKAQMIPNYRQLHREALIPLLLYFERGQHIVRSWDIYLLVPPLLELVSFQQEN